ncbi:MAG: hypothetical protein ABF760_05795 [Zymomonas mobilis]|uniref:Lipoprotein n=1 Tax=Zymomonas mobilis TaxID=542 RepID=A0A542W2T4_ZYMMB|nr:hypothetical protein [Zymomonas mobilis]TQL17894.1 hypothetical protein FBY58_1507 [Zymomonas mobilis]
MKLYLAALSIIPALFTISCNTDPKLPTESNFKKAVNQYYQKHCIPLSVREFRNTSFPISLELKDSDIPKLQSLVSVGLLSVSDTMGKGDYIDLFDKKLIPKKTFSLTEKGKKFLDKDTIFCAGHLKVDTIENFTEPASSPFGGVKFSGVIFTTSPEDLPDWAQNNELQTQWPELKNLLEKHRKGQLAFIQTNKGWIEEHDLRE